MADPREAVDREEFLQRAAAETREPEEARRLRADGDDSSRRDDGVSVTDTAEALAQTRDRLRDTGNALEERQRELGRSATMAEEVAQRAAALRADTAKTVAAARAVPTARIDKEPMERGED